MNLELFIDRITPYRITGWSLHRDAPEWHTEIIVRIGSEEIGRQKAQKFRRDLEEKDFGEGDHAYEVSLARRITRADLPQLSIVAVGKDGREQELLFDDRKWFEEQAMMNLKFIH